MMAVTVPVLIVIGAPPQEQVRISAALAGMQAEVVALQKVEEILQEVEATAVEEEAERATEPPVAAGGH